MGLSARRRRGRKWRRTKRRRLFYEGIFRRFVEAEAAWLETVVANRGLGGVLVLPWGAVSVAGLLENLANKLLEQYGQEDGSPWPHFWPPG